MKHFLILFMVFSMIFSVGCFVIPDDPVPDPIPDPDIICEGGHYSTRYTEWSPTGCPNEFYPAGTYWINANGRMFLLGDPVPHPEVFDVYGKCPTEYIEEIFKGKGC